MAKLRVAVIESPNAVDLFDGRSESEALVSSCKLIGHQALLTFVRSRREFQEVCRYLGAADSRHASRNSGGPLFLHLSCHGNDDGIEFGSDFLSWADLVRDLEPVLSNDLYRGSFALSLSSCGSGSHSVDEHLLRRLASGSSLRMPQYIFSIQKDEVAWADALLGWVLLYHKLSELDLDKPSTVREALRDVLIGTGLCFFYHRWDEEHKEYRTHRARAEPRPVNSSATQLA